MVGGVPGEHENANRLNFISGWGFPRLHGAISVNETPASPVAFQDSISAKPFNPIWEGMKKGAIVALALAALYALAVPLFFAAMNQSLPMTSAPENLQEGETVANAVGNPYVNALLAGGRAFLVGGIPAFIFGIIGGGLIGASFRYWVKRRLSLMQILLYGLGISLTIVGIRILLLMGSQGFPPTGVGITEPSFWIGVAGPMIIASLGFWWVGYQVNTKMPKVM